ncbi:hypothetical protein BS47DRAFT_367258 [Hydnum rufescens UP504]|uniref:Uncharacterized protein n=1 Tax=Hydnum rufescens UP504 TaxID=1448309 RepID=A0A9P6AJL3_9AGAM|nr:hypothetical protein BS47DRAFT_367258 [Hydnum rufescens UP504]
MRLRTMSFNELLDAMFQNANPPESAVWRAMTDDLGKTKEERSTKDSQMKLRAGSTSKRRVRSNCIPCLRLGLLRVPGGFWATDFHLPDGSFPSTTIPSRPRGAFGLGARAKHSKFLRVICMLASASEATHQCLGLQRVKGPSTPP